ncbi:DUF1643 domain-containing protein [candidate division KSB1 bacterium]|nr:DUF1643 domain-containing protein [candidate division KSB1 bacterium]
MKIQKGAIISKCKNYQYALWRIWDTQKPLALFLTLNPSPSEENEDSATVLKCVELGNKLGFGGIVLGYIFGYRTDDPNDFINVTDPVGPENDACLERFAAQAHTIIAAWGIRGSYKERHDAIMRKIPDLHCFGITENGQPIHPLGVTDEAELKPIRVEK